MELISNLEGVRTIDRVIHHDGVTIGQVTQGDMADQLRLYMLFMQFPHHKLPALLTAIQHADLDPKDFAIQRIAIGHNEETDACWVMEDHGGFFYSLDSEGLIAFSKALAEVLLAHPSLYN